jgi:hypothetical protein
MSAYLDLSDAPHDAVERVMWLSGMAEAMNEELNLAFAEAYYTARLQHRLDAVRALGIHSNKKIMAFTRAENERRGRMLKWGDNQGA